MSTRDYQKIVGIGTLTSFLLGLVVLAIALADAANSNGWAVIAFLLLVGSLLVFTGYTWFIKLSSFFKGNKKQSTAVLNQDNPLSDHYVDPDERSDDETLGDLEDLVPESVNRFASGLTLVLIGIPVALVAIVVAAASGGGVGTFVLLFLGLLVFAILKLRGW